MLLINDYYAIQIKFPSFASPFGYFPLNRVRTEVVPRMPNEISENCYFSISNQIIHPGFILLAAFVNSEINPMYCIAHCLLRTLYCC